MTNREQPDLFAIPMSVGDLRLIMMSLADKLGKQAKDYEAEAERRSDVAPYAMTLNGNANICYSLAMIAIQIAGELQGEIIETHSLTAEMYGESETTP